MARVRPRFLPPVSWVSDFLELNLRTYVRSGDRPGIFFLSIDADSTAAVFVARRLSPLPYVRSHMSFANGTAGMRFESHCPRREADPLVFSASYQPNLERALARAGALDAWLTERYCLYVDTGRWGLVRGEIHHKRWPLRQVKAAISINSLGMPFGLDLSRPPDRLHYSDGVEAIAWPFEPLAPAKDLRPNRRA